MGFVVREQRPRLVVPSVNEDILGEREALGLFYLFIYLLLLLLFFLFGWFVVVVQGFFFFTRFSRGSLLKLDVGAVGRFKVQQASFYHDEAHALHRLHPAVDDVA